MILVKQILLISITFLLSLTGLGQNQFTPYDDCPGIIKSYKPTFQKNYPKWAKMLYQYPVNYHALAAAYKQSKEENKENLKPIVRYYKLWTRKIQPWVLEDGTIQLPNLEKYYQERRTNQLQPRFQEKTESNWTFIGPKETFWLNESGDVEAPSSCPWQVNIYSFDVAPSNTSVMYCGTETGYVNKSLDQGETWELLGLDYSFGGGITATAIDPQDENTVYVAAGNQIHKTTNGGITWIPLLDADFFNADQLIIDSSNSNKIAAATSDGIFVSEDAGTTWNHPWTAATYDVAFQPNNSDVIFGLTQSGNSFRVVKSTDGGITFEIQNEFPSNINNQSGGLLAVTPDNPNKLMAVLLSSNNTPYLYSLTIDSNTWELTATGQTNEMELNNGQGYYDLILEISPTDENLIYVGTTTLFKSTNGGASFTVIGGYYGNFAIHPDCQDMKILPNGNVWLATDGGMTLTTDNYLSPNNFTSKSNGIIGSDMWGFDQGWNEDLLVGGRYHNGNTAVADFYQDKALRMGGAESPTGWVMQGKSRHVAFNDLGNGWILPATAEGMPEGRFIFSKYPNMDEYGGRRSNLVFHPNYYGEIYLGADDYLWKSKDMGITWELLYEFENRVRFLQISSANPQVLYVDIRSRGLYRSEDGGITWEQKPALTSAPYGSSYWKGKLHFVISPTDENTLYACLQNGTWSDDLGEVFRSTDGGDTWEDWTGNLSEYTKNLVIQPDAQGYDLVYLFSNTDNGQPAKVYQRGEEDDSWSEFDSGYPSGITVNLALPFFRDSKLRVAGNSGFWESPLAEETFLPIINPWVEKQNYNCLLDTLYFDDHSILNHEGVSWHWEITPPPSYFEDQNIRNPKVVLGSEGAYDVTLTVTKNGETFTKTINNMVTTTTCPSIDDCSNPAAVPKDIWQLVSVDSEETNYPGLATMAFDDDPNTIWHTAWSTGSDPYPHEIIVDMGATYHVSKFTYLTRQDGENGRIKEYELYISEDLADWGDAVSVGEFENTSAPQTLNLEIPKNGRYWKLVCLSEVNGNAWSSAAEFDVVGCTDLFTSVNNFDEDQAFSAYPIPTKNVLNISLPESKIARYSLYSIQGKLVLQGKMNTKSKEFSLDISSLKSGIYFLKLVDFEGREFRIKVVKE